MNAWLLPVTTAAWWLGLLLGYGPARAWPVWAPATVGLAALASAAIAAPAVRHRDLVAEAGLVDGVVRSRRFVELVSPPTRSIGASSIVVTGLAMAGVVALAVCSALLGLQRLRSSPLAALAPDRVEVEATLREDPRPGVLGWHALADVRMVVRTDGSASTLGETVWLSGDEAPPAVARGDLVHVAGSLQVPDDPDFLDALHAKDVAVTLRASEIERLGASPNPFVRATQSVRATVGRSIEAVFPAREAGLLMGLALGDDSRLDPGVERDFKATGLTHLLVVSGGNVAMVLAPVLALVTMIGVPRPMQVAIGLATVAFIVVLTGAEPSVMRAGAMSALTLVGLLLGRARSTAVVLSGAVLILLILQPELVRSIGFQLSVTATAGMVAMAAPLGERFARLMPTPVAAATGTTLAAQLGVTPILLYHFHDVPGVTVIANVLAAPTVAPSLLLGLMAAGAGMVAEPIGHLVGLAAQGPMRALELIATIAGRAPVAHITSGGGPAVLFAGIALVVALTAALRTGWRPPRSALIAGAALLPMLVWSSATSVGPPRSLTVRFLDVGQGDAALVTTPAGVTMLVDGGPEDDDVAVKLAALGVKRIDVVVASHPHADHVVGLPSVLARFQVGLLLQPGCPSTSALQVDLDRAIEDEGIEVRTPWAGESFIVGDVRLDVLSPHQCYEGTESDTNNDALVVRLAHAGDVVLFATEPEEPAQEWLLDQHAESGLDLGADLLKVPHHGAATSVAEFFDAVAAPVAVVSVGENTYGHPVATTLGSLADAGSTVWRTDEHGTITVTFDQGVPVVTSER
ncbi:MAG: ComEC/Rec2 family competence protein [Actinomycetota bacterium]|nr:ComEC/Rec2 family competence protein [Actinomycetota bacterium]